MAMTFAPFKLDRYLVVDSLASGGMAEVFRAILKGSAGFERQVALKRILPNYSGQENFLKLFEREANLCSQLNHPNIVHVYDFMTNAEGSWLAMEFVHGKSLHNLFLKMAQSGQRIPVGVCIHLVMEMCKGLYYAHELANDPKGHALEVIHRDISPHNVMISYDGQVKIVDFGVARAANQASFTLAGSFFGKVAYLSPEQVRGDNIDRRADIFQTGIVLYEILTGLRLFVADTPQISMKMIRECNIPDIRSARPEVSENLDRIIRKALEPELTNRYQSMSEILRDLEEEVSSRIGVKSPQLLSELMAHLFAADIKKEKERATLADNHARDFFQKTTGEMTVLKDTNPRGSLSDFPKTLPPLTLSKSDSSLLPLPPLLPDDGEPKTFEDTRELNFYRNGTVVLLLGLVIYFGWQRFSRKLEPPPLPREPTTMATPAPAPAPAPLPGTLEIFLSHDAQFFIEGKLLGDVGAHNKFRITLEGEKKHKLRFINSALGIDETREVFISSNGLHSEVVNFLPRRRAE